ncbi:MAG: exodeoxyribonuclease VII large subunit, partial [Spirochaetales bacterium]
MTSGEFPLHIKPDDSLPEPSVFHIRISRPGRPLMENYFSPVPVWSVRELTYAIKNRLEEEFPSISVSGEISNCRPSAKGHIYFTLKDADASIAAALFRGRAAGVSVLPQNGMQAVITGKIDVYPPRGSYQIIVSGIRSAGRGSLLEELEKRKQKLAAEGLFAMEKKKPLPLYPRRVAVVTSPSGAALQDILQVLERRKSAPRITVLPSLVQGSEAPGQIASQIRRAAAYNLGNVVIIARGGGSAEDLAAFNTEEVVRAAAACPLPLISGVGHETDVTLCDLAADVRAPTPSAAAELVSSRSEELLTRARGFRRTAAGILAARLEAARSTLKAFSEEQLQRSTAGRLEEAMRRSDDAARNLTRNMDKKLKDFRNRLERAVEAL